MSDERPFGDALGRPSISEGMRDQLAKEFATLPPTARGALIVVADQNGARGHLAANLGNGWKVAAGGGFRWAERKPEGFIAIQKVW